jgi:hypothetical protein
MAEIDRVAALPPVGLFSEVPAEETAERRRPDDDNDRAATMQRLRVPFEADPAQADPEAEER